MAHIEPDGQEDGKELWQVRTDTNFERDIAEVEFDLRVDTTGGIRRIWPKRSAGTIARVITARHDEVMRQDKNRVPLRGRSDNMVRKIEEVLIRNPHIRRAK